MELAREAEFIRCLYAEENIRIGPKSGLSQILDAADILLAENEIESNIDGWSQTWKMLHLERLTKSLKPLAGNAKLREYLIALKSGYLDFLRRKHSPAKNKPFELEVWRSLNSTGKFATLNEPDVVLTIDGFNIGFACKKIYSERGVPKVLSNAVRQIRDNSPEYGFVAFNIDDLIPGESILKAATYDRGSDLLSKHCHAFMTDAERHLLKYFGRNEIAGVLVSCSTIVETTDQRPHFSNMQQW